MKFVVQDLRDGYTEVVRAVQQHGHLVSPRGYNTREIEDASVEILDCTKLLPLGVGRDPKVAIGAAEALLLCAGLGSPSLLTSVAGTFKRFMDGGQLHGAYGPRVRGQMESVVNRLRSDASSRQAIVTIWDPAYDCVDTRDMPCTLGFGFRIRDDALHMSALMRSQDVWLGLSYDAFFFGQLGWTVANVLGLELSRLTIHQYSLHLYERNYDDVDKLVKCPYTDTDCILSEAEPTGFGQNHGHGMDDPYDYSGTTPYEVARLDAEAIYNRDFGHFSPAGDKLYVTTSEQWYIDVLGAYYRETASENFSA